MRVGPRATYVLCVFYAKQKNVKIIVWTWASCVRENPEDWIKKMKDYGVSGAKIDFFERNDQIAMRWGRDFAQRWQITKWWHCFMVVRFLPE